MKKEEIEFKIAEIAKEVFNDQNLNITRETVAKDVSGWDSLTNLVFIDRVEEEFKMKFSLEEIISFKNIGSICDSIEQNS